MIPKERKIKKTTKQIHGEKEKKSSVWRVPFMEVLSLSQLHILHGREIYMQISI